MQKSDLPAASDGTLQHRRSLPGCLSGARVSPNILADMLQYFGEENWWCAVTHFVEVLPIQHTTERDVRNVEDRSISCSL